MLKQFPKRCAILIYYTGMIHCHFTVYLLIKLFSSHSHFTSEFLFKFYISQCKTKPIWLFLPSFVFKVFLVILRSVRCSKLTCHPSQAKNYTLLCVTPGLDGRLLEMLDPTRRHQTQKIKGSFHICLFTFVCTWLLMT